MPDVVRLPWPAAQHADEIVEAALAAFGSGVRRVEVVVAASDSRRGVLHRAGFRREGRLRSAVGRGDGTYEDGFLYARLADDETSGPAHFSTVMNGVLPRTRAIGHALFRDEAGRVLLLEVSYKRDWELPGGVVEPHESPRVGCEREVVEEIGLVRSLPRLLCVDWLPPYLGWDDAIELIFDGGVLTAADRDRMVLGEGEVVAAHWVEPDRVGSHVYPLAARRLEWLLAHPDAAPALFEDGSPVTPGHDQVSEPPTR